MAELIHLSKIDLISLLLDSRCQSCKKRIYDYDSNILKKKHQTVRFFGCLPKSPKLSPPPNNQLRTSPIDIKRRIHPLPQ